MKKIVSALIVTAMLLATLAVCILPSVAAEDPFFVTTSRGDSFLDEDDRKSVPGYKYTDEGFMVNPLGEGNEDYRAVYPNNTPYITVQTSEEENLMAGFYMEVRVDDLPYVDEAGTPRDKWFGFSIWDSHWVQLGPVGTDADGRDWGHGVETLVVSNNKDGNYVPSILYWYDDTVETTRKLTGTASPRVTIDDEERQILTLEITYKPDSASYEVIINGAKAPAAYNEGLTAWLTERGHKAYIGVSCQTALTGGTASFTITKIGESRATATVPSTGTDCEAIQHTNVYDPIMDPSEVEEGQPAFSITGNPDSYKVTKSRIISGSALMSVTEDLTFKFQSLNGMADPIIYLNNEVSYDLKDFPVVYVITKNYCTCGYVDLDWDGVPDPMCLNEDAMSASYFAGGATDGDGTNGISLTKLADLNVTDEDGNTYSVYVGDFTEVAKMKGEDVEQRIHGVDIQFRNIKYTDSGRDTFEVVEFGHIASVEDAEAYAYEYLDLRVGYPEEETDPSVDTDPVEDTDPAEDTTAETESKGAEETESKDAEETESKPAETESKKQETETQPKETETSKKPAETEGKKPAETQPKDDGNKGGDDGKKSGCGSVAGFGALAIVAVAGIGLVSFKKKED